MCSNVKSFEVGVLVHPAVMFMNSNKSESNIRQLIQKNRQKCSMAGIALMNETIGQYDTVVVENMTDITADESDLDEFMHDAANIGVGFFELSTMQYHIYDLAKCPAGKERPTWSGGKGC